jgi:flavodoxin short chain
MAVAKIVYASMTGNTEKIAELVDEQLSSLGLETELNECTDVEASDFQDADVCVIATYTYGEGELPDEIADFYEDLQEVDLSGKIYGVIGSGDKSYDDLFCKAVDDFEEAFEKTGAAKGAEGVKIEFAPEEDEDIENIEKFAQSLASAAEASK